MNIRHLIAVALVAAVGLAACGKKEAPPPAPVVTQAPAPTPAPAPAPPPVVIFAIAGIELGNAVGMDGKVVAPAAVFAPADALHAVVATTGTATDATLAAKWTYEDGQTVNEESRTISPTADAWTDFMISKPDGWPVGKYKVEISLNGAPAGSREFEVT